jgi:SNF2 family DNA or RNA helicase
VAFAQMFLSSCEKKSLLLDSDRWYKLIQKPFDDGDECGLVLLKTILRPLMLRRTKDSTDKDGK